MNKHIILRRDARHKLFKGAEKLSEAVTVTLGPYGRNVIIEKDNELPHSTKDGVTVAKSLTLEDPIENIGAEILKQSSIKTANQAGDGTTTTTLLAFKLFKAGLPHINNFETNAVKLKKELEEAAKLVIKELKSYSKEITKPEQLEQIATISANNDSDTGKLVSSALDNVGKEGVVSIEESKTGETYLETVEGMQFDRGYKSPYFVTNNNTMQCMLDNPYLLIVDGKISSIKELLPILNATSSENKSLLVIAEDYSDEVLAALIVNKMQGILQICAVKSPEYGERRTLILEDIALLTGGTVVNKDKGILLEKINTSNLGKASKITVSKEKTTIIDGKGSVEDIENRAKELKEQIDNSTSPFEKEKLQDRLAKLASGVAIIYVGGANDIEIKEYKDRVEDALYATKAALEEGILPGGGVALFKAREVLNELKTEGSHILYKVLSSPFNTILQNAGIEDTEILSLNNELLSKTDRWIGFNLKEKKWTNMLESGIIDPTKVIRVALENATSVAGTFFTTEAVIYSKPEDKKKEQNNNEYGQY